MLACIGNELEIINFKEEKTKRIVIASIVVLIILAVFVGCSTAVPAHSQNTNCPISQVQSANSEIKSNWSKFQDEVSIADRAARISLPPIVEKLQSLRREGESITVPTCMLTLKQYMINAYQSIINAYLNFMSGGSADTSQAMAAVQKFSNEANRIASCLPNC